jgi:hypothetical protein
MIKIEQVEADSKVLPISNTPDEDDDAVLSKVISLY